ncbi:MAG: homoserine kinase [Brevundimonas sp.]|uniref:Homoserine kinase n=1 Tax=Brevundimonas albigilva TaxID=1312364 RepID=A0ABY4SJZ9_9CAUL|nr:MULTISPECIES: homoserine kinase [Brevundimonas]PZU59719.1 MAG: homoserine kinase [Brevundimonas sp.]URI14594.1 homoserine kinase [Brevundimonas albigilva]
MAVFTPVTLDQAQTWLAGYELGRAVELAPIAEGVENTNYRLETDRGRFVLTLFEGRTDEASLPFCLGLTAHLADRGFPAPRPVADRSGGWLGRLNGRAAAVIEWKTGAWLRQPSPADQAAAGAVLARLHQAAEGYAGRRSNPVGPPAWRRLADRCAVGASGEDRLLLDRVEGALARLGDPFADDLPTGAIHADYFPDNVLFEDGAVSGVIDFYFGCTGALAYDLAIALSAWGFDADGRATPDALAAFQRGYEAVRPLSEAERQALPRLGEAAALRFTLTRLHDRIFHDPSNLVTPKDPAVFLNRLDHWRAREAA